MWCKKPERCEDVVFMTVISLPGLLPIEGHRQLTVIAYCQKPVHITFLQQLLRWEIITAGMKKPGIRRTKAPIDNAINRGQRMNHTIRMLASYPPSGKEKGYEAPPWWRVCSLFVSQYWHSHSWPDKRSMNCGSGTVKRRWQPHGLHAQVRAAQGVFPAYLAGRFIFSWHPFLLFS